MGCDIHLYIEYKNSAGNWVCFGDEMNPGRTYGLFATMAGVRDYWDCEKFALRGVPRECSSEVKRGYCYYIRPEPDCECCESDYRHTTREDAERSVEKGYTEWWDDKKEQVVRSDWHSASWLTANELDACLTELKIEPENECWFVEYRAVVAALRVFEKAGYETRIVFWFDN